LVLFPNCKVNLGLHVLDKRADGYHNLETVFYPLSLCDAAEITTCPPKKEKRESFELTVTGAAIPGDLSSNLCTKAWKLIKKNFPDIPHVRMHLHKAIPVGAGLGGGSSDGAYTLMLLNEELKLNIPYDGLVKYALELGSDCPFFILNKPCYASGRGEIMEQVSINLSEYYFVIVRPELHISTAEAFNELTEKRDRKPDSILDVIKEPVTSWKGQLINDFEEPLFAKYPELKEIKQGLYAAGAEYASMTGTGSSVYGIFHNSKKSGNLSYGEKYQLYTLNQSH
jgi:4-diphosphocytidyl-2-C-methyl-D-erythritol kinase